MQSENWDYGKSYRKKRHGLLTKNIATEKKRERKIAGEDRASEREKGSCKLEKKNFQKSAYLYIMIWPYY